MSQDTAPATGQAAVPGNEDALAVQGDHGRVSTSPGAGPIDDPGLPPHQPRPTDVSPAAARRAERQIALLFVLSSVFALLFCVAYFVFDIGDDPTIIAGYGASNVALGVCLGLAFLLIGVAPSSGPASS